MSSTRRVSEGGTFSQERFASAQEFERGLMANLVAKRCSLLDPDSRQLIWFLQLLSHRAGGIKKLAAELITKYPDRVATASMRKFGTKPDKVYSAAQVRAVRNEMGSGGFPLYGEIRECELEYLLEANPQREM
ncbi:MAG: hypothetical protein ACREFR_13355 [Limisphaerales bacterium]